MNPAVDQLAISIFRKSLDECSADELRQMANQFPWFAPAQLLYAKKLQAGNPALYEAQVQKASLYFQNRLWLHNLLNDDNAVETVTESRPLPEEKEVTADREEIITSLVHEPLPVEPAITEMIPEPSNEPEIHPDPIDEESPVETEASPGGEITGFKFVPVPQTIHSPIMFEPYHTIDYFASQGIKFREEEKPKDQFSQQLKSFTEWLKTLKRIPVSEIEAAASDPGGEKKAEQLAEHSLAERHVITEAMAEVWVKQGNRAKAEEIYRKLSLLDPLKTAYFAAKIEDLKKTS